jgi:peptidoglycan/xylan/chitin deacetylase (PgdA/CDA1 family)
VVDSNEVVYDRKNAQVITRLHEMIADSERSVVLTFDDGPGKYLSPILDVLQAEAVPAMFFWQTRLLYPERPWRRVLEEGHMLGSHTCKHPDLRRLDYEEQYRELSHSKHKLEQITGQPIRYFRPPFGQFDTCTLKAAEALDLNVVMWSTASFDWELKGDPGKIITNVVDHMEDGAIVLLHELRQTVEALPELIAQIRARGYRFALLP